MLLLWLIGSAYYVGQVPGALLEFGSFRDSRLFLILLRHSILSRYRCPVLPHALQADFAFIRFISWLRCWGCSALDRFPSNENAIFGFSRFDSFTLNCDTISETCSNVNLSSWVMSDFWTFSFKRSAREVMSNDWNSFCSDSFASKQFNIKLILITFTVACFLFGLCTLLLDVSWSVREFRVSGSSCAFLINIIPKCLLVSSLSRAARTAMRATVPLNLLTKMDSVSPKWQLHL